MPRKSTPSSPKPTSSMKVENVEEICKILDACSKNGVVVLKYGCLEVRFKGPEPSPLVPSTLTAPGPEIPVESPAHVTQAQTQVEKEALEEQEIAARHQQVAELLLEDPLRAEEMMERGELELPTPGDVKDDGSDDQ